VAAEKISGLVAIYLQEALMAEAQVTLRADTADAVEAFNNFADSAESR
jgi:hypothetical protein